MVGRGLDQGIAKKSIVLIGGKDTLAVIAGVNDVLWLPRNDEAGKTFRVLDLAER